MKRGSGFSAAVAAGLALGIGYLLARWFRNQPQASGHYRPRDETREHRAS